MNVQQGEMFSLSVHLDLDDIFTHRSRNVPIMEYSEIARETFNELYRSGAENGRMIVLNIHPWLIGQPFRIKYLDEMLAHMTKYGGVWKATGQEIIDWYKAHSWKVSLDSNGHITAYSIRFEED